MARVGSYLVSALLHGGAMGVIVWAGLVLGEPRGPVVAVNTSPTPPVAFVPMPERTGPEFEKPVEPTAEVQVEDAPLEYEREPEAETAFEVEPMIRLPDRPMPRFGRPFAAAAVRLPAAEPPPSEPVEEVVADTEPVEIHNPPPGYPARARRRGLEGEVVLDVVVLPDGSCGDASVVSSRGGSSFVNAATDAVRAWRFRPATRGGLPVRCTQRLRFVFKLKT